MRFTSDGKPGLGEPLRMTTEFDKTAGYPSWLVGSGGTSSTATMLDPATTPGGGIEISTTTALDNHRQIDGPTLDLNQYSAVRLRAHIKVHSHVGSMFLGFTDANAQYGAGLYRAQATGNICIRRTNSVTGHAYVNTQMTRMGAWRTFDFSVLLDCKTRDVYLMQGDQVNDVWRNAAFSLGAVVPRLYVRNDSSFARTVTLRKMTLDRWIV